MKKSKIIVPALGLLLLSTAASVSGTVAWFTANRTYNASLSNIAVVSTTGALKGSFAAGVGTSASSDSSAISVTDGAVLTHGSVNHANKLASWPLDDGATTFGSYTISGTKATDENEAPTAPATSLYRLTDASGNKVYSAFTFSLTLTYTTSNVTDKYGLFFNVDSGKSNITYVTNTAAATEGAGVGKSTYRGFRLAFIAPVAENTFVWAPEQNIADCHYVSAVDGTTHAATVTSSYATGELIAKNTAAANLAAMTDTVNIVDGMAETDAKAYYNYMGTFAAGATRQLTFLCIAWFEGESPDVITGSALDTVTANLHFETRRVA